MPRGLSITDRVVDVAQRQGRGLSVTDVNRKRFIRYRDISDGETQFFGPDPGPITVQISQDQGRLAPATFGFLDGRTTRQSVTLAAGEDSIHALILGPGTYLFGSTRTQPGKFICWPNYNDLSTYSVLTYTSDADGSEQNCDSMQYDPVTDAVYVSCGTYQQTSDSTFHTRILKVNYTAMTYSVLVNYVSATPALNSPIECDGSYLYLLMAIEATASQLVKFDISTGAQVGSARTITGRKAGHSITKDASNIYCAGPTSGSNNGVPWAAKIPKDLSTQTNITVESKLGRLITDDSCLLNGYWYVGMELGGHGMIHKIAQDLSTIQDIDVGVDADCYGVFTDGTYLYACMATIPGCIVQFDQTGFIYQVFNFLTGENQINEIQFIPGGMVVTCWWAPATVVRIPMGTTSMPGIFFPLTGVAGQFTASALVGAAIAPQAPVGSTTYSAVSTVAFAPQSPAALVTFSRTVTVMMSANSPAALVTFSSISTPAIAPQSPAATTTYSNPSTVTISPISPAALVTYSSLTKAATAPQSPAALTTFNTGAVDVSFGGFIMTSPGATVTFSAVGTGAEAVNPPSGTVTMSGVSTAALAPQATPMSAVFSNPSSPSYTPTAAGTFTANAGAITLSWAGTTSPGTVTYSASGTPIYGSFIQSTAANASFSALATTGGYAYTVVCTVTYSAVSSLAATVPSAVAAASFSAVATLARATQAVPATVTFSGQATYKNPLLIPSATVTFSMEVTAFAVHKDVTGPAGRIMGVPVGRITSGSRGDIASPITGTVKERQM